MAAEVFLLNVRIRDFDEGVYWESIRALARGEPLFSSVYASQPPGFYYLLLPLYLVGRSLASLRLTVLLVGLLGLVATFVAARLIAGRLAGFFAVALVASSPLYFHQSALVQADGPSVALSIVAVALALIAVRRDGRQAVILAGIAGAVLAVSIGIKFLSAVTVVPVAIVLLGAGVERWRLLLSAAVGGLAALLLVMAPALLSPGAAFTQLIVEHLRAGRTAAATTPSNIDGLLLRRDLPLEALALIAIVVAVIRRDRLVVMPAIWSAVSVIAALLYHPLFPHHLVMLSVPLALTAAVGMRHVPQFAAAALVLATLAAGSGAILQEAQLSMVPDLHDMEMASAVAAVSRPGEFWITDNPYGVALANRDVPGPLVDPASQRIRAGLLTVKDLESMRVRYRVRWILEDSFRLDHVPNYQRWLDQHYHAVRYLGGRAVIYQANGSP